MTFPRSIGTSNFVASKTRHCEQISGSSLGEWVKVDDREIAETSQRPRFVQDRGRANRFVWELNFKAGPREKRNFYEINKFFQTQELRILTSNSRLFMERSKAAASSIDDKRFRKKISVFVSRFFTTCQGWQKAIAQFIRDAFTIKFAHAGNRVAKWCILAWAEFDNPDMSSSITRSLSGKSLWNSDSQQFAYKLMVYNE